MRIKKSTSLQCVFGGALIPGQFECDIIWPNKSPKNSLCVPEDEVIAVVPFGGEHGEILELLKLFNANYDGDLEEFLREFAQEVWEAGRAFGKKEAVAAE